MRHVRNLPKMFNKLIKTQSKPYYDAGCRYLQFDDVYWGSLCNNHLKPEFEADKAQALENIQVVLAA